MLSMRLRAKLHITPNHTRIYADILIVIAHTLQIINATKLSGDQIKRSLKMQAKILNKKWRNLSLRKKVNQASMRVQSQKLFHHVRG